MKHKNLKGSGIVGVIFIIIVSTGFLVILFWMLNLEPTNIIQPTYTQSEVSALMKFNASEFGCNSMIPYLYHGLKIACTGTICNKIESVKQQLCWIDPQTVGQFKPISYFPQFDGVKIELEPERQECWNETIEERFYVDGVTREFLIIKEGNFKGFPEIRDDHILIRTFNETKCQTVPAVEKEINPWAVSENDLATEFCRAKTYHAPIAQNCTKQELQIFDSYRIWRCIESTTPDSPVYWNDATKSFTRGEVVEVDKFINCRNNMFGSGDLCDTKKQKVIRCTGDDGTQKYFEAFK